MLISLAIRDIILIERLDLEFERLCALTGETGAGKSILLDALGLALGGRAERALVRPGAAQGSVSAAFAVPSGDRNLSARLDAHGLALEDSLVLRRVVGADGRSRAFVNDQPVSTRCCASSRRCWSKCTVSTRSRRCSTPASSAVCSTNTGPARGARRGASELRGLAPGRCERADIEAEMTRAAAEEAYWRHAHDELDQLAPTAARSWLWPKRASG